MAPHMQNETMTPQERVWRVPGPRQIRIFFKLFVIVGLFAFLFYLRCSQKHVSNQWTLNPATAAADLGKDDNYFKELYGAPKIERQVSEYVFGLPAYVGTVRLTRPMICQDFESGKLRATVLYSVPERRAIWVKYYLQDNWTDEQVKAALAAYASEWKQIHSDAAVGLLMPGRSPVAYGSSTGVLAYKTLMNELMVYSPRLYLDLRNQIEENERQKKAVPKF